MGIYGPRHTWAMTTQVNLTLAWRQRVRTQGRIQKKLIGWFVLDKLVVDDVAKRLG